MAGFYSLVVYDSVLFYPGRDVHRWALRTQRRVEGNAKRFAPVRSGELRNGISGETFKYGPKHWQVHVHSDAPHTLYVIKGTKGPIMSRRMWGFRQRTGLSVPRGGARSGNPTNPRGYNMNFLREQGYLLKVRPGKGFPMRYALTVEGQSANNFLAAAMDASARTNRSLRRWEPAWGY